MKNDNFRLNHIFFKGSIELFHKDLKIFSEHMSSVSSDELLDLMAYLVAVKEFIEALEIKFEKIINE